MGAVRVMQACTGEGQASQTIAGLDWVAANMQAPAIVSMSLGSDRIDATIEAAVSTVVGLGVTVITAAGNSNSGECGRKLQCSLACRSDCCERALIC